MSSLLLLQGLTSMLSGEGYDVSQSYSDDAFDIGTVYINGPLSGSMNSRYSNNERYFVDIQLIVHGRTKEEALTLQKSVNDYVKSWHWSLSLTKRCIDESVNKMIKKPEHIDLCYEASSHFEFEFYANI